MLPKSTLCYHMRLASGEIAHSGREECLIYSLLAMATMESTRSSVLRVLQPTMNGIIRVAISDSHYCGFLLMAKVTI